MSDLNSRLDAVRRRLQTRAPMQNMMNRQQSPAAFQQNQTFPGGGGPFNRPVRPQQQQSTNLNPLSSATDAASRISSGSNQPAPSPVVPPSPPATQPNPQFGETGEMSPYGQPLTGPVEEDQWGELLSQNVALADRIRAAYRERYGLIPGGNQTLVSLVNKIVNEGYPEEEIFRMIEGGYNTPDIYREAADAVALEYGPQEQALINAQNAIRQQQELDVSTQEHYARIASELLGNIYGDLGENLDNSQQQIQDLWSGVGGDISQFYQQAGQRTSEDFGGSLAELEALANQLGIQQGYPEAATEAQTAVQQDLADLQSMGAARGAQAAQLGGVYGTGAINFGDIQSAYGASQQAGVVSESQRAAAQITLEANQAISDLIQQGVDLSALQGASLRDAVTQLQQIAHEQGMDQARLALDTMLGTGQLHQGEQQLALERYIADRGFDLENARLDVDRAVATGDIRLVEAQIQEIYGQLSLLPLTAAQLQATIQGIVATTSLTYAQGQEVMANIGLIGATTGNVEAETAQIQAELGQIDGQNAISLANSGNYIPGANGFNSWVQDAQVPPTIAARIRQYVDYATNFIAGVQVDGSYTGVAKQLIEGPDGLAWQPIGDIIRQQMIAQVPPDPADIASKILYRYRGASIPDYLAGATNVSGITNIPGFYELLEAGIGLWSPNLPYTSPS